MSAKSMIVRIDGEAKTLKEWGKIYGLKPQTIYHRIKHQGKTAKEAVQPIDLHKARVGRFYSMNGKRQSIMAWCRDLGIKYAMVMSRISNGWTIRRALLTPSGQKTGVPEGRFARACKAKGVDPEIAMQRISSYGWSRRRAMSTPILNRNDIRRKGVRRVKIDGQWLSLTDACAKRGVSMRTVAAQSKIMGSYGRVFREYMFCKDRPTVKALRRSVELGGFKNMIAKRLNAGWTENEAFSRPKLHNTESQVRMNTIKRRNDMASAFGIVVQ